MARWNSCAAATHSCIPPSNPMKHHPLLAVLPFFVACSVPQHTASRVVTLEVPAAALRRLACTTGNGHIRVVGSATATAVTVQADLSVRGRTPAEAEANLRLLDVRKNVTDDGLTLAGVADGVPGNCSPTIAFTIGLPASLDVAATTHNGEVRLDGGTGAATANTHNGNVVVAGANTSVRAESHNGDVEWRGEGRSVALMTHNGDATAAFTGQGEVQAVVTTHNGDVRLAFPGAVDASFAATTANGSIRVGGVVADVKFSDDGERATGRLGKGGAGRVQATTHNGDVKVQ